MLLRPRKPGWYCPSGPPWILMITGRGPAKDAGGRYRNPVIERPSKLFHEIFSGSERAAGSRPPISLSVQRSIFPDGPAVTSIEYTSDAERAEDSENARSFPFS